jgi:hypothetical protein
MQGEVRERAQQVERVVELREGDGLIERRAMDFAPRMRRSHLRLWRREAVHQRTCTCTPATPTQIAALRDMTPW